MKLALILHSAAVLSARPKLRAQPAAGWLAPIIGVERPAAVLLILAQPDLGTALVIWLHGGGDAGGGGTAAAPARAARRRGGGGSSLLFALIEPYRRARLTAFLEPVGRTRARTGFQSVQGQIAIGSGGLFGVGPGQSVQKIYYLPEAHTDFILAVIGEELGLAGICGLLVLYGMIGYAGLRTAKAAKDATPSCWPRG